MLMGRIVLGDNLDVLRALPDGSAHLVYVDPPFNTGKRQSLSTHAYDDRFGDDFLTFLEPRLRELHRVLAIDGSLFFHIDARESHYCKVLLDSIFGRAAFLNEIIWAYDYGGRSKRKWSNKHDTIFWYARDPANYTYDYDAIDRVPYMAPGLVGPEKAARGKTPTDVWWQTIVPTNSHERTGYPTQKPLAILERIVRVHSRPGDLVLDCFAGSGTTGEAAAKHGRDFLLVDQNPEAVELMATRLAAYEPLVER
jgi:site-specific DNA-methyltransferase (adenine-specific)